MDRIAHILSEPSKQTFLVVGLARSGIAAALALRGLGAEVVGTDRQSGLEGLDALEDAGVRLELGGDHTGLVRHAGLVVLSPGVQLRPLAAPIPSEAIRRGVPVIGELELAHRLLGAGRQVPVMAVTGTNGKSTTTSLCAHLLEQSGQRVFLGGNLGRPLSELVHSGQDVDWAVVEVSSFQLEHLSRPSAFIPKVGVWLNLTPDHLDRHVTLRNYARMKRRMFEGMGASETGVFFLDDSNVNQQHEGLNCTVSGVSRNPARVPLVGALLVRQEITPNGWDNSFVIDSPRLRGEHNAENAACAACAALAAGLEAETIQAGLDSYSGLPHRLEPVRELDQVQYINDSKGTNPDATSRSLSAFGGAVVLIAGGRGKGTGYSQLREVVREKVAHLILLGEEADNLARELEDAAAVHRADDMRDAVLQARRLAEPGGVVLLSPACASFDMFSDYAERGRVFTSLVHELTEDA